MKKRALMQTTETEADAAEARFGTTTDGGASAVPAATNSEETFGPFVYIDGRLAEVRFDDGYCTIDSSGRADYHYFVRDYMGSVCVVTDDEGNIEQQNAYYAWGGIYSAMSVNPSLQDRKYSGKPFDRRHGLDLYDYGARRYDPALARWTSPDPLCENYYNISPYAFCTNNPVNRIDIDGMADFFNTNGYFIRSDGNIKDPYIYILNGKERVRLSNYNFGTDNVVNLRKMMRIVYHYADIAGTSKVASSIGVVAGSSFDNGSGVIAYTTGNKKVYVLVKNGHFKEQLSQIYNMISTLKHEKSHILFPIYLLNNKTEQEEYEKLSEKAKSHVKEVFAITQQMQSPSFNKATNSYKRGIGGYLQETMKKLYRDNIKSFDRYQDLTSTLLEEYGMNGIPKYDDGGAYIEY